MPVTISAQIETLERMGKRLDSAHVLLDKRHNELISFLACLPLPAWIKDLEYRMIYINPAYEQEYGVNVEDYNSKLDSEMWVNESAAEAIKAYLEHDELVVSTRSYLSLNEQYVDPAGKSHPIKVLKWPLIVTGDVVAVASLVITEI